MRASDRRSRSLGSVTPSVEDLRIGAHARLRLSAAFHRLSYTSHDPSDAYHFGRHDREVLLGAEAAGPVGRSLTWFARYEYHGRTGSIADPTAGSTSP